MPLRPRRQKKRLEILNKSNDGFFIASEDLKLRDREIFFGIRQSGDLVFALADIYQDAAVLQEASEEVKTILEEDPELTEPGHHILQKENDAVSGRTAFKNEFIDFGKE